MFRTRRAPTASGSARRFRTGPFAAGAIPKRPATTSPSSRPSASGDQGAVTYRPLETELGERAAVGLRYLGLLVENADSGPASFEDLRAWATQYQVSMPFVIDPGFKIGVLRTNDLVWPINFFISTRDMKIAGKVTGADPEQLWSDIDQRLGN